eukprot:scaffold17683_cov69-Phaeocystis_antarctica.AAC.17
MRRASRSDSLDSSACRRASASRAAMSISVFCRSTCPSAPSSMSLPSSRTALPNVVSQSRSLLCVASTCANPSLDVEPSKTVCSTSATAAKARTESGANDLDSPRCGLALDKTELLLLRGEEG